jgi:hypothetical protein
MNDTMYIVWVGGVAEYEGYSWRDAHQVLRYWQAKEHDDVVIETVKKVIA